MAVSEHYEKDNWVDYARGLGGAERRAAMEAHLSSGCSPCRRRAELWGKLAAVARAEVAYQPPPSVLQRAKAIFTRPEPERGGVVQLMARLVYDSFRDPLPAGMRAGDRPSQALFEAGQYSLDLHLNRERVDRERGVSRMVLVGQIAHRSGLAERVSEVPVLLVSGRQVVARGVSNERGEFHLEFDPQARVRLRVPVEAGKRIEIRLPRSTSWGTTQ